MGNNYIEGFHCNKPSIRVIKISEFADLSAIPKQPGFYLIFTDYKSATEVTNNCKATLINDSNVIVIYRGESYNVQKRLQSHLFHESYLKNFNNDSKDNNRYTVCLKIEKDYINLDTQSAISNANWYVAYHGFPKSTRIIRVIAEKAFDYVFGKPFYSRD